MTDDTDNRWDGTTPSDWMGTEPFEQRGVWEWWRWGVIEGRTYGPGVTEANEDLYEHSPRKAAAYNSGIEHSYKTLAEVRGTAT